MYIVCAVCNSHSRFAIFNETTFSTRCYKLMGCEGTLWNMLVLDSFSALADVSAIPMLIDSQCH